MKIEIIDEPIRFHLHGIGGVVENERYGEVGLRLMNEMWQAVKGAGILTTGINHWVYLPDGRMFVGVELRRAHPAEQALLGGDDSVSCRRELACNLAGDQQHPVLIGVDQVAGADAQSTHRHRLAG